MADSAADLQRVPGSLYKAFPSFIEWLTQPTLTSDVDVVSEVMNQLKAKPPQTRHRALDIVRNVAALETGAIEDLYPSDRGLTITAVTEVAMLEAVSQTHSETVRGYVAAALDAYEHVSFLPANLRWRMGDQCARVNCCAQRALKRKLTDPMPP